MDYEHDESHPSYGLLGFSRTSGINRNLFGSSIKHNDWVTMRLYRAVKRRSLNRNWYHSTQLLAEVELSATQFAEMITSMNVGDGVPCTLTRIGGEAMPDCPEVNERQLFVDEFEAKIKDISEKVTGLIAEAQTSLAKKNLTKSDREALVTQLNRIRMELISNMPFIHSQFNRAVDHTVLEAKGEVEAFVLAKVHSLGVGSLQEIANARRPQLENE